VTSAGSVSIAIVGAGNIGSTLGKAWQQAGHHVVYGRREPAGSIAAAIAGSDVVLLAVPGRAVGELVAEHAAGLAGRIVIDAANDMSGASTNSAAGIVEQVPTASIYRAFNSLGWENYAQPLFGDVPADLFYCGPDGDGRPTVEQLITDVGLRPVRVGDLDAVAVVDAVASLWFALALRQGHGRHLAFKMLT
jgi:predicted dinucleotide-binding enzyme